MWNFLLPFLILFSSTKNCLTVVLQLEGLFEQYYQLKQFEKSVNDEMMKKSDNQRDKAEHLLEGMYFRGTVNIFKIKKFKLFSNIN